MANTILNLLGGWSQELPHDHIVGLDPFPDLCLLSFFVHCTMLSHEQEKVLRSLKCLFAYWVKTFQFWTHSLTYVSYFQFRIQGCLFLKIEDTILYPGLTHLKSSSIKVSTIPEQRPPLLCCTKLDFFLPHFDLAAIWQTQFLAHLSRRLKVSYCDRSLLVVSRISVVSVSGRRP